MEGKVYLLETNNINIDYFNALKSLPEYCKNKLNVCSNIELKNTRILAWYTLYKILLADYNIDLTKCNIYENNHGKPYIDEIYFNITHSKNYIGIIISNVECGIDIEKIELKIDKDKFAKKILTDVEYAQFLKENTVDFLINKWTKIETYYKILGEGLSFSNLKLETIDENIQTFMINNDYFLSYGPCKCDIINVLDLKII